MYVFNENDFNMKSLCLLGEGLSIDVCWGKKLMPLNEMLGNQTETRLWALKMTPIGFQCDDKPIQARRKKDCT